MNSVKCERLLPVYLNGNSLSGVSDSLSFLSLILCFKMTDTGIFRCKSMIIIVCILRCTH